MVRSIGLSVLALAGSMLLACAAGAEDGTSAMPLSPISNAWGHAETTRLDAPEVVIWPAEPGRSYHHHAQLLAFDEILYATFSSGEKNEDDVGQRVMFTRSDDAGKTWSAPRPIVIPPQGAAAPAVACAAGLHAYRDEAELPAIVAYYGQFEYDASGIEGGARKRADAAHRNVKAMAIESHNGGETWSEPKEMAPGATPNISPVRIASGRLVWPGHAVHHYTDDPTGLTGWRRATLPGLPAGHVDDSAGFASLFASAPDRLGFCEGSVFQTDDGVLHMMLRSNRPWFAVTESRDNGATWGPVQRTSFSDCGSRHQFGRLPDGRYYALSTPDPKGARTPLVLAVSRDGVTFDRHFIVGDAPNHPPRIDGMHKGGRYGYPAMAVQGDTVVVMYSVAKEDVAVSRFPLSALK